MRMGFGFCQAENEISNVINFKLKQNKNIVEK